MKYYNPETGEEEDANGPGDWVKGDASVKLQVKMIAKVKQGTSQAHPLTGQPTHMIDYEYTIRFINMEQNGNPPWLNSELTRVFEQACPSSTWAQGFKYGANNAEFGAERTFRGVYQSLPLLMALTSMIDNIKKTMEARGNFLTSEEGHDEEKQGEPVNYFLSKVQVYELKKGF